MPHRPKARKRFGPPVAGTLRAQAERTELVEIVIISSRTVTSTSTSCCPKQCGRGSEWREVHSLVRSAGFANLRTRRYGGLEGSTRKKKSQHTLLSSGNMTRTPAPLGVPNVMHLASSTAASTRTGPYRSAFKNDLHRIGFNPSNSRVRDPPPMNARYPMSGSRGSKSRYSS